MTAATTPRQPHSEGLALAAALALALVVLAVVAA
jgi:hypothetical protein